MRDRGIQPHTETYNSILRLLDQLGQHETMFAILTDMDATGVAPDIETYNLLLHSTRFNDLDPNVILVRMDAAGVERNAITYQHLIISHIENQNLEMSLQLIDEMSSQGIQPTLHSVEQVVDLATRFNFARLAVDLAVAFEEESIRRLPPVSWMKMLACCAALHYVEGAEHCWAKGVVDGLASPDEGVCIDLLNVSARAGRPDLATDVIRVLTKIGVVLREHHLAPVLEAFMKSDRLKDALATLSLMRHHSIAPNETTTEPIFRHIIASVEEVDKAYYILEDLKNDGKAIDISAVNVVIRASVELDDLQRAVATYRECEKLGVIPTRDTYYYLLDACIKSQHQALGEKLYEQMKQAGLKPDSEGLERMIMLSLTQSPYEEAFYYLEEMKSKTSDVPARVYEAIIRKCVVSFDPRWKVAAEEMQQRGYTLSSKLLRFISKGDDAETEEPASDFPVPGPTSESRHAEQPWGGT
ncbi:hypothetical protein CALVIDRAFT_544698 [Calocera viscosa TUFC12733]|uniref:Pentatricopeptide repeat-containing protein-mitochondrial domain-containing protein n=1 Tax=Calocera viscosa (strain TUFC12733) TaxID=1330018 RepID=A0A167PM40_CALVF|nr:hypothetical protein CALVIDRAFT_544698 [Calocera viscosa TUFC12733]